MFKWPIIVLLALSNLCFSTLMMSLEETLSPIVGVHKGVHELRGRNSACYSHKTNTWILMSMMMMIGLGPWEHGLAQFFQRLRIIPEN